MSTSVFSGRRSGARLFSRIMRVVLAFSALILVGCAEKDDGGSLVCGDREAWVLTKDDALKVFGDELLYGSEEFADVINEIDAVAVSFRSNGDIVPAIEIKWTDALVEKLIIMYITRGEEGIEITPEMRLMINILKPQIFERVGGKNAKGWYGVTASGFTWSQRGNDLILTSPNGVSAEPISVAISGNTFTITDTDEEGEPVSVTFTKKNIGNITLFDDLLQSLPGIPGLPGGGGNIDNPGTGGNLVLGEGQAWTYDDGDGWEEGYIFTSDGRVIDIGRYERGSWGVEGEYTYSVSDGNITVNFYDIYEEQGIYTVSGDTLILTMNRDTEVFKITNGVVIEFEPLDNMDFSGLTKSPAKKKVAIPRLFAKKTR